MPDNEPRKEPGIWSLDTLRLIRDWWRHEWLQDPSEEEWRERLNDKKPGA